MSNLEKFKNAILEISKHTNLPEVYKDTDIERDFTLLNKFKDRDFVWLLRTHGTTLIPTKMGVDPYYVTRYLWSDHDPVVKPFSLVSSEGTIEKITYDRAEQLILEQPMSLSALEGEKSIIEQVNKVLSDGCYFSIWGVFENPASIDSTVNWVNWQKYFLKVGNHLMSDYMGRALRSITW